MFSEKRIIGHELELLSPETMKLLGSTEKGSRLRWWKCVEVILVDCNLINNY